MNKTDLIKEISDKTEFTQVDCAKVVDAFIGVVVDALKKGDEVNILGFGKFEAKERAAREGINPQTKEKIKIPASKAPAFKAGKAFKDSIQ